MHFISKSQDNSNKAYTHICPDPKFSFIYRNAHIVLISLQLPSSIPSEGIYMCKLRNFDNEI